MENEKTCSCKIALETEESLKLSFKNEVYSIFGNLNKGEKIIIKYFGNLCINDEIEDRKILLNYGYGNLWSDKNVIEMTSCCHSEKKCYCAELNLTNNDNLFFCFMDNNNNWDLNNNSSYMINIDDSITTMAKKITAVTIADEEYISFTTKLFKALTDNLLNLFAKIGSLFDKKVEI